MTNMFDNSTSVLSKSLGENDSIAIIIVPLIYCIMEGGVV